MKDAPITDEELRIIQYRIHSLGGSLDGEQQRTLLQAVERYRLRELLRQPDTRLHMLPKKTLSDVAPILERAIESDDHGVAFRFVLPTVLKAVVAANVAIAQMVIVFAESNDLEFKEGAVRHVADVTGWGDGSKSAKIFKR